MMVAVIVAEKACSHAYEKKSSGALCERRRTFSFGELVVLEERELGEYVCWAEVGESRHALFWPYEFEVLGDL